MFSRCPPVSLDVAVEWPRGTVGNEMTTMTNAISTDEGTKSTHGGWPLPSGKVLMGTAVGYAALFVGMFVTGGNGPGTNTAGEKIIADYDHSTAMVQVGGYAAVIAATALIFFGAGLRRALRRDQRDWLADVAFAGTIAMGVALVGFAVTAFAMYDAVKTGNASVAQSINILDHANFVPAMLGLCCTLLATGLSGLRSGALPKWLSIVSIVLGVASPLGPAAFAPFALFPVWVIVVAVVTARRLAPTPSTA
jgi:hypothetical protein